MKLEIINGKIRVTPAFVMHRSEERLYEIKKLRHRVCRDRVREAMTEKNLIGWPKYRSEHAVATKDPEYQWLAQIGKQSFDRLAELRAAARRHWPQHDADLLVSIEDYSLLTGRSQYGY